MPTTSPNKSGSTLLVTMAALVIVIAGVKTAQALLVPFLLALFISIVCVAPFNWLQKRRIPAGLALLIVISVVVAGGLLVLTLVGSSVNDFTNELPTYQEKLQQQTLGLLTWLETLGVNVSKEVILEYFDPSALMQSAASMLATAGGMLTNSFLILLTVIFVLLEAAGMPNKMRAALNNADTSLSSFERFHNSVKQYLAIKTLVSFATGLIVSGGLLLIGLDFALLWGLIAFLLNYVPNIGSIIAAVPAILLAIVQLGALKTALVALIYIFVNVVMGSIIEPRLMGKKLGLSPLVVFISLVFWGWVLGPVGMLLSVPLTMIVKIALEVNESTRWMSIMISSDIPD